MIVIDAKFIITLLIAVYAVNKLWPYFEKFIGWLFRDGHWRIPLVAILLLVFGFAVYIRYLEHEGRQQQATLKQCTDRAEQVAADSYNDSYKNGLASNEYFAQVEATKQSALNSCRAASY